MKFSTSLPELIEYNDRILFNLRFRIINNLLYLTYDSMKKTAKKEPKKLRMNKKCK